MLNFYLTKLYIKYYILIW